MRQCCRGAERAGCRAAAAASAATAPRRCSLQPGQPIMPAIIQSACCHCSDEVHAVYGSHLCVWLLYEPPCLLDALGKQLRLS